MYRNPAQDSSAVRPVTGGVVWPLFVALANAVIATFWSWQYRYRYRRELSDLDDHMLRDIGVTSIDARGEASKPFWRV